MVLENLHVCCHVMQRVIVVETWLRTLYEQVEDSRRFVLCIDERCGVERDLIWQLSIHKVRRGVVIHTSGIANRTAKPGTYCSLESQLSQLRKALFQDKRHGPRGQSPGRYSPVAGDFKSAN